jgi:hypothetical protein
MGEGLLFELGGALVGFVLVDVDLDAGGTDRQQALLALAEVGDVLLGVVGALEFWPPIKTDAGLLGSAFPQLRSFTHQYK